MSYILLVVFLYLLSVRQKVAKNSAHGRTSRSLLLLVNCLAGNITRPSLSLPLASFSCARCKTQASLLFTRGHKPCRYKPFCRQQGAADLDLRDYIRKFILAQIFGHTSHNGLLPTGLSAVLLTVPFSPLATDYLLQRIIIGAFRELYACNGYVK